MKAIPVFFAVGALLLLTAGCSNKPADSEAAPETAGGTPVTVTSVSTGQLTDSVKLRATAYFLLKTPVKAATTGYLTSVQAAAGDLIRKGQSLFVIRTKEAAALGNTINALDTSFHFSGLVTLRASANGYVTSLNVHQGDFVQEGDVLATISEQNSFAFLLELPYELRPLLEKNKTLLIQLPDGSLLQGQPGQTMPVTDALAQTQQVVIKTRTSRLIPEGLIAHVVLLNSTPPGVTYVPAAAVLTNETQNSYWVMKLINDSTAVKVPVTPGLSSNGYTALTAPAFSESDRILLTGQYGLPDTAQVVIHAQ